MGCRPGKSLDVSSSACMNCGNTNVVRNNVSNFEQGDPCSTGMHQFMQTLNLDLSPPPADGAIDTLRRPCRTLASFVHEDGSGLFLNAFIYQKLISELVELMWTCERRCHNITGACPALSKGAVWRHAPTGC